uniref:Retrotransposon gag domain-containing protein n=1 Tax=Noccaea caerulescens TaxID=107243 RepID=A0A1J3C7F8_NOCCA
MPNLTDRATALEEQVSRLDSVVSGLQGSVAATEEKVTKMNEDIQSKLDLLLNQRFQTNAPDHDQTKTTSVKEMGVTTMALHMDPEVRKQIIDLVVETKVHVQRMIDTLKSDQPKTAPELPQPQETRLEEPKPKESINEPVRNFVERLVDENSYDASSDAEHVLKQGVMKDRRNKWYYADRRYYKIRKKRSRKREVEISRALDRRATGNLPRRFLGVNTVGLKKQDAREKKATQRGLEQACNSHGLSRGSDFVNRLGDQNARKNGSVSGRNREWKRGVLVAGHDRGGPHKLNRREDIMSDYGYRRQKGILRDRKGERLPVNQGRYGSDRGDGLYVTQIDGVGRNTEMSRSSAAELEYWLECFERHCSANHIAASEKMQVAYHNLQGPSGRRIKELWDRKAPSNWEEFKRLIFQKPVRDDDQPRMNENSAGKRTANGYMGLQIKPGVKRPDYEVPREIEESNYEGVRGTVAPNWYRGIRQEGSVREYRLRFEALCLNTNSLPGCYWEEIFSQGLKPQLQYAVKQLQPQGLIQMMDVAQWIEESEEVVATSNQNANGEYMRLVLVTVAEKVYTAELLGKTARPEIEERVGNSLMTNPSTDVRLKVSGIILGHNVAVVIDCGATNNVISEELANRLHLPIRVLDEGSVLLGHGLSSKSKGTCVGVTLLVQDIAIKEEYLVLSMNQTEEEVTLGYEWLAKLGETCVDWKSNTMSFTYGNRWVTIGSKEKEVQLKSIRNQALLLYSKTTRNTCVTHHFVLIVGMTLTIEDSEAMAVRENFYIMMILSNEAKTEPWFNEEGSYQLVLYSKEGVMDASYQLVLSGEDDFNARSGTGVSRPSSGAGVGPTFTATDKGSQELTTFTLRTRCLQRGSNDKYRSG